MTMNDWSEILNIHSARSYIQTKYLYAFSTSYNGVSKNDRTSGTLFITHDVIRIYLSAIV